MKDDDNDDSNHALAAGLFAFATGLLEDAHEVAAHGQAAGLDRGELRLQSRRLGEIVQEVAAIAAAIAVVVEH